MWGHHHHHHGGGYGGYGGSGWHGGGGGYWGHPHYYGGGGGGAMSFLGGMMMGSAVSNMNTTPTTVVYQTPPVVYQQPQPAIDYQARADADSARRSAEMALSMRQSTPEQRPGLTLVKVVVPEGTRPGQSFAFTAEDRKYSVVCPASAQPGQEIYTYIPETPAVELHEMGRRLYSDVLNETSTPAKSQSRAILIKDHVVDENALSSIEHNIISGREGDVVDILDGTIDQGLAPPYDEYCLVRFDSGRTGKVSRFLLKPYREPARTPSAPPRALLA